MRHRPWILGIVFLVVVSLGASGAAQAATITFSDAIPMTLTNWNDFLFIQQFNPGLGTLTGIDFTLTGGVLGDVLFEGLGSLPSTVVTGLQASITVSRPDLSVIASSAPVVNHTTNITAFDGVVDFAGGSGRTFLGEGATVTDFFSAPPPASDLALFTGLGVLALPVSAFATSFASGGGNIQSEFHTDASAALEVVYTYNNTPPPVPEPSTLALLLLGGGVVALGSRMRKNRK